MDYVAQKNTLAPYSAQPEIQHCQWSADDCYPVKMLTWLAQQTEPANTRLHPSDAEFEGV